MDAQLKRFQRTVLATELETDLVIVSQRMWLLLPHPKNLPEAKLRSFGLISLAEETSMDSLKLTLLWLLVITLLQTFNGKEKWGKKKWKMFRLRRKKEPRNLMLAPRFVLREMRRNG